MNKEIIKAEVELKDIFLKIDEVCLANSKKVIDAFHNQNVNETCFNETTGYGYNDYGREVIEKVYAEIFGAEKALVRNQFISGSHAISKCLFGVLRPNDTLLAISGRPYDTLDEVIGIKENPSSLKAHLVNYHEIDLINDDFNYEEIKNYLENNTVKMVHIQRSCGYALRKSLSIEKVAKVIELIKSINSDIIVFVDNCYCEMVGTKEPTEVGADLVAGSLIKNLGAGICSNGAYVVGKEDLVELVASSLNLPGEASEVGPSLGANKAFLQGLYFAPLVVSNALKVSLLLSRVFENMGYQVLPSSMEPRYDIVSKIVLNDPEKLVKFCNLVQHSSAVDASTNIVPAPMPGYDDKIVMASGSFTQGSSIELSCDGPLRKPYVAYFQGSLTYEYGKIAVNNIFEGLKND